MANDALTIISAFAASTLIGLVGYRLKIVDGSGYVSGVLLATIVMAFLPLQWFAPLLALVVVGGAASRYKYSVKKALGVAEESKGRSLKNVLGNGGVALACATLYGMTQNPLCLVAYVSSLAGASADTLSSEFGQLSKSRPRLITSLQPVKVGTDGGITLQGTAAGAIGATLLSSTVFFLPLTGLEAWGLFMAATIAGFLGTLVDSVIGATLESKKVTDKHTTNFLACLASAAAGVAFYLLA